MELIEGNFLPHRNELVAAIKAGKLFIYPTDTVYGIGCDAKNKKSVERIRKLKHTDPRFDPTKAPPSKRPFLVVAPSIDWIYSNCEVSQSNKKLIEEKLPGRYAFFLNLRKRRVVAPGVALQGTLGVRLLNHKFQEIIKEAGIPFISTSVNISGQPFAEELEQIPESIKQAVDYIIYQGPIAGPPSTKINLTEVENVELKN